MNKTIVNILAALIPLKKGRKKIRALFNNKKTVEILEKTITDKNTVDSGFAEFLLHQQAVLKTIKNKKENNEKIRVAFIVFFESEFASESIFQEMLNNDSFEPFIIITPVLNMLDYISRAKDSFEIFSKKYPNSVRLSFEFHSENFIDLSDEIDIVFPLTLSDEIFPKYYKTEYLTSKNILSIYVPYAYNLYKAGLYQCVLPTTDKQFLIFTSSHEVDTEFRVRELNPNNTCCLGYPRADMLLTQKIDRRERKKIIFAPHSLNQYIHNMGHFMANNSDFILNLFEKYSEVDFVFRIHMKTYDILKKDANWTDEYINKFENKLHSLPNVIYEFGGLHFYNFMNSDAIIHDSGSFAAEYLMTGKPACQLVRTDDLLAEDLTPFGERCINYHYRAYTSSDVTAFVENVINEWEDPLKRARLAFVKEKLLFSAPFVGRDIVSKLEEVFSS